MPPLDLPRHQNLLLSQRQEPAVTSFILKLRLLTRRIVRQGRKDNISGFEDLSTQDEPFLYEVLDEALPPGSFSDRDYQNALKSRELWWL